MLTDQQLEPLKVLQMSLPKERGGTENSHREHQGTCGGHENVGFGVERGSKRLSCALPAPRPPYPVLVAPAWS